ncbi:MAG: RICIN domain-containing protein [Oscillospiraceae bacterium]|nr:RICIN domain-containing protein [Oscillospiraceae bacterium]
MKKIKAFLAAVMMLSSLSASYAGAAAVNAAEEVNSPYEGYYIIRNVNSGLCLNVEGGSADNGTNVQQWGAARGADNCIWRVEAAGDNLFRIYSMVDGGKNCLLNVDTANNNNINIYENTGADTQLFYLMGNADGSFRILSKANAQVIEVINAETSSGANVQTWGMNGVNCQDWELVALDYAAGLTETEGTAVGEGDFIPGDLNDDGVVDGFDSAVAKRVMLKETATQRQKYAGNVSGDEKFSVADIVQIQKFLLTGKGDFIKQDVPVTRSYPAVNGTYEKAYVETTNAGFESEAYVNLFNEVGSDMSLNVKADTEGVYAVTFRYANGGTADRNVEVKVSGESVAWTLTGAPTGAWTTWAEETLYLPLKAGVNRITLTSLTADGAPNLDFIAVNSTAETESASTELLPMTAPNRGYGVQGVGKEMEDLDRGLCATLSGGNMLVSWRSLATDPENMTYKLYKNGELVGTYDSTQKTNVLVSGASAADVFTMDAFVGDIMVEFAEPAIVLGTKNSGQSGAYTEFAVTPPAEQTMPDGTTCTYTPNDTTCGDVDGDGQYELIVKWDPSNSRDNANDGYSGSVFIDCYKLDGTRLWRIDLGRNIRAGAHYTQMVVADLDSDGKAEMMLKTADGTVDGKGTVIGDASKDYRGSDGRIIQGPEYLTLFDGQTGAALDTIDFSPARGTVGDWGDTWGNRCDRMLATVAYLDGKTPSAVFGRGYYAKTAVTAYDVENKKIVKRWSFDTGTNSSDPAFNQGNHSLIPMDVDGDGAHEILYGSVCFESNGTVKWSTGLGHGDCMQAGDLIPERPGLEVFQVHEHHYCAEVHDAATGEIIWKLDGTDDVGRGIALNLTADSAGMEFTSVVDGQVYAYNPSSGKIESQGYGWNDKIKWSMNTAVWWDGDLEREAMDRTMIEDTGGRKFTGDGSYNNASKSNACLTADLFGDWREEVVLHADGNKIRIFGTTFETETRLDTLMHDDQYRCGVATENVGYNQAPNTSFFLGTGYDLPAAASIYTIR